MKGDNPLLLQESFPGQPCGMRGEGALLRLVQFPPVAVGESREQRRGSLVPRKERQIVGAL
jgi:hypothetical protein